MPFIFGSYANSDSDFSLNASSKTRLFFICFFLLILLIGNRSSAQEGKIYKPWTFITEQEMKDVHFRVLECNGRTQVHLRVFNDSQSEQFINFHFQIISSRGEKFEKEIKFSMTGATRLMTECSSDSAYNFLKLDLPKNFDPYGVAAKVLFKD
jgi:hypothetical protein